MIPAEVLAKIREAARTDSSVRVPESVRLVPPRRLRRAGRGRLASPEGGVFRMPGVGAVPLAPLHVRRRKIDRRTVRAVRNLLKVHKGDVPSVALALHESGRWSDLAECRRIVLRVLESTK